jgi:polypeptide N-acetylgalactosaminyltransferase
MKQRGQGQSKAKADSKPTAHKEKASSASGFGSTLYLGFFVVAVVVAFAAWQLLAVSESSGTSNNDKTFKNSESVSESSATSPPQKPQPSQQTNLDQKQTEQHTEQQTTSKTSKTKQQTIQKQAEQHTEPTTKKEPKKGPTPPAASPAPAPPGPYAWEPKSMSVILPCAGEGEFALKTVIAVHKETPSWLLHEIVVVDDGSSPPLKKKFITKEVQEKYNVKLMRHKEASGLIRTKKDGGDAATGEVLVFFDCHVAPQPGWYKGILRRMAENYRRVVVPSITDLDIDTWTQRGSGGDGLAKCYATWDADFKWFNSNDDFMPVLSGGLLAISKRWWNETGGYDSGMFGWGGENVEQSLRTWLCGGEIMFAKEAQVAHMWRKPDDPRTNQQYYVPPGSAQRNRLRAAKAWFSEFAVKVNDYPNLYPDMKDNAGNPWYGDLTSILEIKEKLQCQDFAWFLNRFKDVYIESGMVPNETYLIRSGQHCLTYLGPPGTSMDGTGSVGLRPCNPHDDRQRWHGANRNAKANGKCCSALRAWNTDQCLQIPMDETNLRTTVCDINGMQHIDQHCQFTEKGRILCAARGQQLCIGVNDAKTGFKHGPCNKKAKSQRFLKDSASQPIESELYEKWLAKQSTNNKDSTSESTSP